MALKMTADGNIIVENNPVIEVAASGIVSLANNQIQVNDKNLLQEIRSLIERKYSLETDHSGNFAGRVSITLEILCDHTKKEFVI